jgi:hypothetical protein
LTPTPRVSRRIANAWRQEYAVYSLRPKMMILSMLENADAEKRFYGLQFVGRKVRSLNRF